MKIIHLFQWPLKDIIPMIPTGIATAFSPKYSA